MLEESNIIYSPRKESVVEQSWLLGWRRIHRKWALENFWVMEIFYILMVMVIVWLLTSVKTPQTVNLQYRVHLLYINYTLRKLTGWAQNMILHFLLLSKSRVNTVVFHNSQGIGLWTSWTNVYILSCDWHYPFPTEFPWLEKWVKLEKKNPNLVFILHLLWNTIFTNFCWGLRESWNNIPRPPPGFWATWEAKPGNGDSVYQI